MAFAFFVVVVALAGVVCNVDASIFTLRQHADEAKKDEYFCTSVPLPPEEGYIIGYQPQMKASVVHHMILFGCTGGVAKERTWRCDRGNVCSQGEEQILYAWALQADGLQLPNDVGFKVGGNDGIRHVSMEIHYHDKPTSSEDDPILELSYTNVKQRYVAGIFLVGAAPYEGLPPGINNYTLDAACIFKGPNPLHPFAFRTHTHTHGTAMYGYTIHKSGDWQLIGSRNPQDPQTFYPVKDDSIVVNVGDVLAARTYYNTTSEGEYVMFGGQGVDEMCNFYIMYYTINNGVEMIQNDCWRLAPPTLEFPDSNPVIPVHGPVSDHTHHHHHDDDHAHIDNVVLSTDADSTSHQDGDNSTQDYNPISTAIPDEISTTPTTSTTTPTVSAAKPTLSTTTKPTASAATPIVLATTPVIEVDDSWLFNDGFNEPINGQMIGAVSAVDVDSNNNVYVLHRADVQWSLWSFDDHNIYNNQNDGPITDPVLLKIDSEGKLVSTWGRGVFYMPHGLRVSRSTGQYWFTDVARHQVLKTNKGMQKISVLGNKFVPGVKESEFCKPADIELDEENNRFFVADGYCNHRVLVYTLTGDFIYQLPSVIEGLRLFVPHSLALSKDGSELYVADRQNSRIIVYDTNTREGRVFVSPDVLQGRYIYGIGFGKEYEWPLYAVSGSMSENERCLGFTIDRDGQIIDTWGPPEGFRQSHDIAVSDDGRFIYIGQLQPSRVWRMKVNYTGYNMGVSPTDQLPVIDEAPTNHATIQHPPLEQPTIVNITATAPKESNHTMIPPATALAADRSAASKPSACDTCVNDSTQASNVGPSPHSKPPPSTVGQKKEDNKYASLFLMLLLVGVAVWVVIVTIMCCGFYCAKKIRLMDAKQKGTVQRHYSVNPNKKLRSLLKGPAGNGFTPISAHDDDDSGSDEEETTVFQQKI